MKRTILVLVLVAMVFCFPLMVSAEEIPARRVAISRLTITGDYSSGVREWLPRLIESRLQEKDWTIVDRESYQDLLNEQNLQGTNPATVAPANEHYGATALLKLTVRVTVNELSGGVGVKVGDFDVKAGSWVNYKFEINGQIVDVRTGKITPVAIVGSRKGSLESLGLYIPGNSTFQGGAVYNDRIRETLAGKAADDAAGKLVEKLNGLYQSVPAQTVRRVNFLFKPSEFPRLGETINIFDQGGALVGIARIAEIQDLGEYRLALCDIVEGTKTAICSFAIRR